jgi:Skp family chaperone for outer membrane proteins
MKPLHILFYITTALTVIAQDTQLRIGMLIPTKIIENSDRGSKLFLELESLKKRADTKLTSMSNEIQKLGNQLQSPSTSDAGKELIRKQLRDLDFESKKLQEDSQIELQQKEQAIVTQFQNEITPFVTELAKEQKLQLVLQFQPGLVAYADPTCIFNLSNEIAKRYDAKYKTNAQVNTNTDNPKMATKIINKPTS